MAISTQPSSLSHRTVAASIQPLASSASHISSLERRGSTQSTESFYSADDAPSHRRRKQPRIALHPENQDPSFSFVCLGTGGGPLEGDCSCYLLKPADADWQDGSIVVEGGSWLGALTDVLEQHGPDSAFYDFEFPSSTPSAYLRAGLMASFSQAFLISHAHLDHILGLVLGSASLPGKRAVYGLKPTLENILDMFNGKIWPKLASWKEDEPHTMYHMRSLDNQRPFSVSDTLSVLPFALSHGLNPSEPPAPPTPTYTPAPMNYSYFSKRNSLPVSSQLASFQLSRGIDDRARAMDNAAHAAAGSDRLDVSHLSALRRPSFNSPFLPSYSSSNGNVAPHELPTQKPGEPISPRASAAKTTSSTGTSSSSNAPSAKLSPTSSSTGNPNPASYAGHRAVITGASSGNSGTPSSSQIAGVPDRPPKARRPRTAQGSERHAAPPSAWPSSSGAAAPTSGLGPASSNRQPPRRVSIDRSPPCLDSTAFFITHKHHDRDVLFFGDVEPDCVSKSPRNRHVWSHAAERFADGKLSAMFLECSFPKNHPVEFLYGHLSVEFLFDELRVLAQMVKRYREKSRRSSNASNRSGGHGNSPTNIAKQNGEARYPQPHLAPSPLGTSAAMFGHTEEGAGGDVYDRDAELRGQLAGLGIIIIHVKPALFPSFLHEEEPDSSCSPISPSSSAGGNQAQQEAMETLNSPSISTRALEGEEEEVEMEEQNDDRREGATPTQQAPLPPRQDTRTAPQKILDELNQEESVARLGVTFVVAEKGMRIEC